MKIVVFIIAFLTLLSCGKAEKADSESVDIKTPGKPEVKLPRVSAGELETELGRVPQLSSFLLWQHGDIIFETYNDAMNRNRPANIKSASKNVISALIGIAIQEGYISGVEDSVATYLPEYFSALDDSLKAGITIEQLLTMSSGLRSTSFRNYGAWVASRDWVAGALNGELENPPGTRMRYSTGDTHILSAVITEATGMSTRQFAERYLFGPMNVRIGGWDRDPRGYYFGGNNMALSPAGLLAFGRLYLNGGFYNDRQIINRDWVERSMQPVFYGTSFNPRGHDYGYLWWSNTFAGFRAWFAWGYGGQYLFIIPELDAIVILTGNPDSRLAGINNRIYRLMDDRVIPYLFHAREAELTAESEYGND